MIQKTRNVQIREFITAAIVIGGIILMTMTGCDTGNSGKSKSETSPEMLTDRTLVNSELDTVWLSQVLPRKGKTLIFRVPEYTCIGCVNRETSLIREFSDRNAHLNCLIITGYSSIRDYYVHVKNTPLPGVDILNCESFIKQLDTTHIPYFVVVDK